MVVLELLKAFVTKIKKKNNMKKGHYGKYTGNARHSRKEEMIHDREMIYDAKTQIHNEDRKYKESGSSSDKRDMIHERELIHDTKSQLHRADQDYKNDSPLHYKPGDIHSGSTGAYDAGSNEFSAQVAEVKGIGDINKAYGEAASEIITALGEKPDQKEKPDMTMTKEYLNKRGGIGAANNPSLDPATYGPNGTPGGGNKAFDPNTYSNLTITPTNFDELPALSSGSTGSTTVEAGGGGKLSSFDNAWKNDLEGIRTSGMYGGSDNAAKARYIQDVGGQGETIGKGNAREYANEVLPFGATYDSAKHQEDMMSRLFKTKKSNIPGT